MSEGSVPRQTATSTPNRNHISPGFAPVCRHPHIIDNTILRARIPFQPTTTGESNIHVARAVPAASGASSIRFLGNIRNATIAVNGWLGLSGNRGGGVGGSPQ